MIYKKLETEYNKDSDITTIKVTGRYGRFAYRVSGNLLSLEKELKLRLAKEKAIKGLQNVESSPKERK